MVAVVVARRPWIAVSLHGSIWKIDWRTSSGTDALAEAAFLARVVPDGKWIVYTADDEWRSIQLEA